MGRLSSKIHRKENDFSAAPPSPIWHSAMKQVPRLWIECGAEPRRAPI